MKRFSKSVIAWVLAVLTAAVIGVIFQTQNVIARLGNIGADISIGERLSMTAYDVFYLGKPYALFISIAFIFAFLAGGLVFRVTQFGRPVIYAVAGGAAILIMLFAMKAQFFGTHIIAGARDGLGLSFQVMAGILGGWVFARLSRHTSKPH